MKSEMFSYEKEPEMIESRFGDKEKIIEAMMTGDVVEIGSIDTIYSDIPTHANEVDVDDVIWENANKILGVRIQKGENVIRCIFKPLNGENPDAKQKAALTLDFKFYPRECAAYLISEHFDFDIIPPTVIREVNGQIGALQLFLDHDYFQNFSRLNSEKSKQAVQSDDWQTIAVLDWILVNCERHLENMMVRKENPREIAAIDHGIILCGSNYFEMALRGPSLQLTFDPKTKQAIKILIPESLLIKIKSGFERKADLENRLREIKDLNQEEINDMWKRIKQLLLSKSFLSKINFAFVFGHEWLSDQYQN
jgi:hypothetical protein